MKITKLSQKRIALMKPDDCIIVGGDHKYCTSVLSNYNKHHSIKKNISTKKVIVIDPITAECVSAIAVSLIKEKRDLNHGNL